MRTDLPKALGTADAWAVRTRGLAKAYGAKAALAEVDLTVPEGAVYVLVGPNGAGKTTTFRVLLDLEVPDAGEAEVFGLDARRSGARARAQIGYVPERDDAAYGWLTVRRLLRYHAAYYPAWQSSYAQELVRRFEIDVRARFSDLSKGQQRRVQLVMALAHRPPLLLLDEPTDGLDPVMRDETLSVLADHLARHATTVVISTHQVHEAERLGDHVGVMRGGRLEAQLPRELLRRRLRAYRFEVPPAWAGTPALESSIVGRSGAGRESVWTIWGEESEVTAALSASGAMVRRVDALRLDEAALALLRREPMAASEPPVREPASV